MGRPEQPVARPGRPGLPWLTLGLAAVAASLWWGLGPVPGRLVFDRSKIAAGEIWRLVTGHFVHSDGAHVAWNIGALLLIGLTMEGFGRRRMIAAIIAGIAAVDAGLWWGMTDLQRYCGLSGMLNALLVVAVFEGWRRFRHPLFAATGGIYVVKLVVEAFADQGLLVQTVWPSVPMAHVAGFIGGALLAIALLGLPTERLDRVRFILKLAKSANSG